MSSAARIKRGVRGAIAACGGIEGAAATIGKSASLVGTWNNRNDCSTPTLSDALAMDEIAVIEGRVPAILTAMAVELGHVVIRLPECAADGDTVTDALVDASAEFGDIATTLRDRTACDGVLDRADTEALCREVDEAIVKLVTLKSIALSWFEPVVKLQVQA